MSQIQAMRSNANVGCTLSESITRQHGDGDQCCSHLYENPTNRRACAIPHIRSKDRLACRQKQSPLCLICRGGEFVAERQPGED